jgi:hypothetical protein
MLQTQYMGRDVMKTLSISVEGVGDKLGTGHKVTARVGWR